MVTTLEDYVTPMEAAPILGVRSSQIYKLLDSGRIPARRTGGRMLILREDVQRYAAARRIVREGVSAVV